MSGKWGPGARVDGFMPCETCFSSSHSSQPDGGGRNSDVTVSDCPMAPDASTRSLCNHMTSLTHKKAFPAPIAHGYAVCAHLGRRNPMARKYKRRGLKDLGFDLIRCLHVIPLFFVPICCIKFSSLHCGALMEISVRPLNVCVLHLQVYANAQAGVKCVE